MILIDAHAHLWDTEHLDYPWIDGTSALPRVFLPADLRAGDQEATAFVFVQADCAPAQGVDEARWVAGLRAPDLAGIVAHAPLESPRVGEVLSLLAEVDAVVGVRRLLQGEPASLLESDALHDGLTAVTARGWSFDACIHWTQLRALAGLARRHDSLPIVLDHLGKPPVDDPDPDAFARWRNDLDALAALPHVAVKLSGLPAETAHEPTAERLGPYLRVAADLFGPDRCLLGSDFPVSAREGAPRAEWFALVRESLQPSTDDWRQIRGDTARRVYRLG